MEIADVFVINKADRDGAERVEREIKAMQSLAQRSDNWVPPVIKTIANNGTGITELADAIESYEEFLRKNELDAKRRTENWRARLIEMLREELLERVLSQHLGEDSANAYAAEVAEHKRDPYTLVENIVEKIGG